MNWLLYIVLIWNTVDLVGKFILEMAKEGSVFIRIGRFFDTSIYSVSLIILAVIALKLLQNKSP